ncbi:PAS domain S-box protein [Methanospirillum stamsii]|uniref:histidine kinase n=1 Tax=Methanospirillum stamsii TaxID=1277351 RepID=A0A2V2NA20_9EURY|nr:PAS domain S-box protein [Methanospirillum stamsii]PWR75435.1 hypothetical protein DLD82_04675 [Methanospirillum stamsii]
MNPVHVLLVDDEPLFLEAITESLAIRGNFIFDCVLSAQEALQKIGHMKYDVIVSDYSMPEMNGILLLKEIRKTSSIPFILFTGQGSEDTVIDAINSGVDYYLKKGDNAEILFTELTHMIRQAAYRRYSDERLLENEKKYRELFEKSPIGIIIFNPEGMLIDINPAALLLLRISSISKIKNRTLFSNHMFSQETLEKLKTGKTIRYSTTLDFQAQKSGIFQVDNREDTIFVDISLTPHTKRDGTISAYYIHIIDLSAQHLAEEALRKTGQKLSLALEGSRIGLWDWNIKKGEMTFNERTAEIIGYTLPELMPMTIEKWESLTHPEDLKTLTKIIHEHLSGKIPYYESEIRIRHKDNRWVWIQDRGKITEWDEKGRPARMTGTTIDISDRKKTEQQLIRKKNILGAISFAATKMMSSLSDETINEVLSRIGKAVGVSRVYIFNHEYSKDGIALISQKYEWVSEGIIPQINDPLFQNLDWKSAGYERWGSVLFNGGIIYGNIRDFPDKEQTMLSILDVKSIAMVPIFSNNKFSGFVGFDYCASEFEWSYLELETLEVAAGLFGASFERKKLDEEVRIRENNLSTFFNTIEDFIFVLSPEGIIQKVNETVIRRLLYTEEELIGQPVLMVHPEMRRAEAASIISDIIAGKRNYCPIPLITKDGNLIPVETRVVPGIWDNNPAIFGVSKDISALTLSEEKFSKAFHSSGSLMAISRLDTKAFVDVNKTFLDTLGFSPDEVIGKTPAELGIFDDVRMQATISKQIQQKGSSRNNQITIKTKDKRLVTGILSADIIHIQDTDALLMVMNDITEIIRLSDALLQANKKMHLLSSITRHDILNQVQILFLMQNNFERKISPDSPYKEDLDIFTRTTDTIYRQILFTRDYQEMGIKEPVWERVERAVENEKNNPIFSKLQIEVTTGDLEIFTDPMFSKVCYNLLENAIRHGGHVTKITISFKKTPENGIIIFEDNGIGIPDKEKEKIFEQGFGKNTGFGLFLTREILSITKMSIQETGTIGKGARFEIIVPHDNWRYNPRQT